jgi:putative nucleotidyltransferase with HDIG domain
MSQQLKLRIYVGVITLVSVIAATDAWFSRLAFPGFWEIGSFLLVALLLEQLSTRLRVGAQGSTSFVMHLSAGVLFGGFWGALITASSMAVSQVSRRLPLIKILFNVAQVTLAVCGGLALYRVLGGQLPPEFLQVSGEFSRAAVQRDLGLFFVFAAFYFGVNSALVSGAVALSNRQSFREVWSMNTRGVLGYDLGASAIALIVAYSVVKAQHSLGFGPIGLVSVIAPVIIIRHVYGMYHSLQESGRELLAVMVKAIEARDPYTSGHSLRVSALSRAIATELGLATSEVELIETAALLHDVGKIHEEFAPLLRKESRLTDEETALMQTHSTKSAELVGIISKFRGFIQDSVRHHHERWDGQGYPLGLARKDIPLGSRIILISDTIDAMTTDRPYRKRLSLEIVIAELQKCRGTQFDPDIVDVVVSSVSVRRLIGGSALSPADGVPTRSRRVSWPTPSLWKGGRQSSLG